MSSSVESDPQNKKIPGHRRATDGGSTADNNLPILTTSFVGRSQEKDDLHRLLAEVHLITLTGVGGLGKTRLALELAKASLADFPDGVCFVNFILLTDPRLVVQEVLRTVGRIKKVVFNDQDALTNYLAGKKFLLILNNCEHLIDAVAAMVETLLESCPGLWILATSREPLRITGETIWQVKLLSLPLLQPPATAENILQSEAGQLFVERVRAALPGFQLTEPSLEAIRKICWQVDGVPLALELAARWARVLSPEQIASHLQTSLNLLSIGSRTAIPHQQTIRATIEWSYQLINASEKALFQRLAIFNGGFTLSAAEIICADGEDLAETGVANGGVVIRSPDILDLLYHLADKSLILAIPHQVTSFRMFSTVRQFALEVLERSGQMDSLEERFIDYYIDLARQSETGLNGPNQIDWLNRLEAEVDNLRAALKRLIERRDADRGLQLAASLVTFWYIHAYLNEGNQWLQQLLALPAGMDVNHLKAYLAAAELARHTGNFQSGIDYANQALEIGQALADESGIAEALMSLGNLTNSLGNRREGIQLIERSLQIFRGLADDYHTGQALLYMGDTLLRMGDLEQAGACYSESLALWQKLGEANGISFALGGLGDIAREKKDYKLAARNFHLALANYQLTSNKIDVIFVLEALAILMVEEGHPEPAARLWGAVAALREVIHLHLAPSYQQDYAVYILKAKIALGETKFKTAFEEGSRLQLDEAIQLGLSLHPTEQLSDSRKGLELYGLSTRELEVLRLVAAGLTDVEIAKKLFISSRTVSKHLQTIYRKIDVTSRTAAAKFAFEKKMF